MATPVKRPRTLVTSDEAKDPLDRQPDNGMELDNVDSQLRSPIQRKLPDPSVVENEHDSSNTVDEASPINECKADDATVDRNGCCNDVVVSIEGETRLTSQTFSMPRFALTTDDTRRTDLPVHRPLSPRQQRKIVRFDPPWPECRYHDTSKRVSRLRRNSSSNHDCYEDEDDAALLSSPTLANACETVSSRRFAFLASRASRRYDSVDEALAELNGWSSCPEIAIDGTNGCGKSTLARSMNRAYLKINELMPRVTDGYGYNLSVFQSLEYMMFQQSVRATDVVWDRCRYSNLAFYYAHLLMHRFRDTGLPNDRAVAFEALNSFAAATNLAYTVATMEREKPVPVLFLVCRDLEMVALALHRRGTATDLSNAKERDYQLAQYFAYCYFGALLSYPVFDLSDLISERFTLGDLQQAIRDRVDVRGRTVDRERCLSHVPDTASADRLAAFLARVDDVLLYDRSLK